jgi:hypothetical protein
LRAAFIHSDQSLAISSLSLQSRLQHCLQGLEKVYFFNPIQNYMPSSGSELR